MRGNTSDFIDHPLPKYLVYAQETPHHLNPALVTQKRQMPKLFL